MPAAAPPPLHPSAGSCCPYAHHPGHRSLFDHTLKSISSRITQRRLQGTCPPMGRGNFGKPFLGANSYSSPFLNPRNGFHTIHSENSPVKPRIVTVVKPTGHTLRKITLLLNRRSVQTFEQLMADISEALGFPRWKNDRVRKLYNLRGREIRSVSDFFREGDAFIAMGKEQLTLKSLEIVIQELYPSSPYAFGIIQQNLEQAPKRKSRPCDKAADSGFDETELAKNSGGAISPELVTKHEGKTQPKTRQEEQGRAKKKWGREQDGKPFRKAGEGETYFKKDKSLGNETEKISDEIRCEKCQREREHRQKLQRERQDDVSFESRGLNMAACQRYDLEKDIKMRNCRKPSENCMEGEEVVWKHTGSRRSWKALQKNDNEELENQKRSFEKERDPERHENPDKGLVKIKKNTVEAPQVTAEVKKENRSSSRINQSCWLMKDCPEDAEKPIKTRVDGQEARKSKEEGAGGEENVVRGENESTRVKMMGDHKVNKGESKSQGFEGTRLKQNIHTRAEVESYYEIGRTLGDGNFAVVKACRRCNTNQNYAMKIVDKSKLKGKEGMMDNEILIIKSLSHPNIVSLVEVYETEVEIYLILEYVPGGDLFDAIIESVKFTEHDAALMITDLCEALVYIHGKNIVHRDLKPENLLVQHNADKSTTLKLADFGLAKKVTKPIFTVCGTPTYVAPEILVEKGYGLEVDMWATGVILYILLCGFPPFRSQERDQEELFQIIQLGHYEFLSPYWDSISSAAKDLITRLLVVDPQKRYKAQQVLQHPWIRTAGKTNSRNLQREVTINIERHFRSQRRKGLVNNDA
ncbi:serine/threonine-protein kinase DCLK3 [Carettochelys insculpta]|uniref:serine/threonine-protein kinase DCLK3 n=1 Tax=Carettochelys insculpta TaxID=44489 RepID=UPI003EBA5497